MWTFVQMDPITKKAWTAREHLAAMAMQGLMAMPNDPRVSWSPKDCAKDAFDTADAMLAHGDEAPA